MPTDRPVRISADLAYRHGGGQGAAGALVAHYHRQRTGRGQHVDVSIQDYIPWTPLNVTFAAQVQHANTMRQAVGFRAHTDGVKFRFTWPCKDGRIAFRPLVTGGGKAQYEALVAWMTDEGFGEPILTAKDWAGEDNRAITQDEYDQIAAVIERFLLTRTLDELYAEGGRSCGFGWRPRRRRRTSWKAARSRRAACWCRWRTRKSRRRLSYPGRSRSFRRRRSSDFPPPAAARARHTRPDESTRTLPRSATLAQRALARGHPPTAAGLDTHRGTAASSTD